MTQTSSEVIRLVYISRNLVAPDRVAAAMSSILAASQSRNREHDITGVLAAVAGHFLQMLEGPAEAVDALVARIRSDRRHDEFKVLLRTAVSTRLFPNWSMVGVERKDIAPYADGRLQKTVYDVASSSDASASDFFRLICSPGVHAASRPAPGRGSFAGNVVFASPSGIWSAAMLQHLACGAGVSLGRATLSDPTNSQRLTLVEYADLMLQPAPLHAPCGLQGRRVRAFALTGEGMKCPLASLLVDRPAVVTILLSASDIAGFPSNVEHIFSEETGWARQSAILVVCNAPPAELTNIVARLKGLADGSVMSLPTRVSDAATIWPTVVATIEDYLAAGQEQLCPDPHACPNLAIEKALADLLGDVEGSTFAALLDARAGRTLVRVNTGIDDANDTVSEANECASLLQSLWKTIDSLGGLGRPGEVVLTCTNHVMHFQLVADQADLCIVLVVKRNGEQMASSRLKISNVKKVVEQRLGLSNFR